MISKVSAVFSTVCIGLGMSLGSSIPALASGGNGGPAGSVGPRHAEPRPFSLDRTVTQTNGGATQHCEIFMDRVQTTITQPDNSFANTFSPTIYSQDVPDMETLRFLVSDAEAGNVVQGPSGYAGQTYLYEARVAEGGPTILLSQTGPVQFSNESPAANVLANFIGMNCEQVSTPVQHSAFAKLELRAPIPPFVPVLIEIDTDGTAFYQRGDRFVALPSIPAATMEYLRGQIAGLKPENLVDTHPGAPHTVGGGAQEYVAFASDGRGFDVSERVGGHLSTLPGDGVEQIRDILDGLNALSYTQMNQASDLRGIWGGSNISLNANESDVSIEMGCGGVSIPKTVYLDAQGNFEADGVIRPGGPRPVGAQPTPAHVSGVVTGDHLSLTIVSGGYSNQYDLQFGVISRFPVCH